jgi:zinc/manganese transport system permease protein
VTMLLVAALYRPLAVESFDPAFLRAVGGGGGEFRAIFVALVVLNLVANFQAFGTLLAIGPMLLPAAAARCWTRKVWPMVGLAAVFGIAASLAGLLISYYAKLPSGPTIVMGGGAIYGVSLLVADPMQLKPKSVEGQ